jgi:hypothetical protein
MGMSITALVLGLLTLQFLLAYRWVLEIMGFDGGRWKKKTTYGTCRMAGFLANNGEPSSSGTR